MEPFFKPADFLGCHANSLDNMATWANSILQQRMIPVYGCREKSEIWYTEYREISKTSPHQSLMLPPWPIEPARSGCMYPHNVWVAEVKFCMFCGASLSEAVKP